MLNFACSKDCTRTAHLAEGRSELSKLMEKVQWKPKKNDKCDFQPSGEKTYRMCIVKEVKSNKNKKLVSVKYLVDPTTYKKAVVEYPSKRLVQCGEKLSARNDCKFKTVNKEN